MPSELLFLGLGGSPFSQSLFQPPPYSPTILTFSSQVELRELAEDTLGGEVHVAGGQTRVVAQVGGIGPGDV